MNHPGEIAYLTDIARPDVALVNNARRAHLAGLGSVEAVARAKGEIFAGLAADGIAVINADDPHARAVAASWRSGHRVIEFRPGACRRKCQRHLSRSQPLAANSNAAHPQGEFAAHAAGAGRAQRAQCRWRQRRRLGAGHRHRRRSRRACLIQRRQGPPADATGLHGATLIDDTYNANPGFGAGRHRGAGRHAGQENPGAGRHGRTGRGRRAHCTPKSALRRKRGRHRPPALPWAS